MYDARLWVKGDTVLAHTEADVLLCLSTEGM